MIYTVTLNPAIDLELQVPSLSVNDVCRASASREDIGGKGFNVTKMLNNLGVESVALGFMAGANGEKLQGMLANAGLQTDLLDVAGETRINVTIKSDGEHIKVNDSGPKISQADQLRMLTKIKSYAKPNDWWVLAGSLPQGIAMNFYAQLIEVLQAAGSKVVLDTSGEALALGIKARPTLVKPNLMEARQLIASQLDSQQPTNDQEITASEACLALSKMGCQQVVLSLGEQGLNYFEAGRVRHLESPTVQEANPIGAGDALVAGLVLGLANGESLESACTFGMACGAATAASTGTQMPTKAEVEQLLRS